MIDMVAVLYNAVMVLVITFMIIVLVESVVALIWFFGDITGLFHIDIEESIYILGYILTIILVLIIILTIAMLIVSKC